MDRTTNVETHLDIGISILRAIFMEVVVVSGPIAGRGAKSFLISQRG
jgi:hypothetical protein